MQDNYSRRDFLAVGMGLPAAGMATASGLPVLGRLPVAQNPAPPALSYRVLGKTGMKVTSVAFGCMITSDGSVVERAADLGINYFDTARGYQNGNNERMVGAALKSKRKNLFISTKSHGETRQAALDELDTSLRTLGTDYVDIWYLHNKSTPEQLPDELFDAQEAAKKAGKIRFAGVSTHAGNVVIPFLLRKGRTDVVLTMYNFSMVGPTPGLETAIAAAHKAGMGVVAMKVMAGGFRTLKPGEPVAQTLKREGAMLAALKWALRTPNVHTTVPSMTDMEQLDENLKAMSVPFNEGDQKVLAAQLDHIRPVYCRSCHRCEGTCAQGLPVSDIVRYLTYADGYGQFALGREHFSQLPPDLGRVRCQDCPSCTVQCPNGVRVAERVTRAQELFA
jgi:uncharacterized protein